MLENELREVQSRPTRCLVCQWIVTLSPSEQVEWDKNFGHLTFTKQTLSTVAKRHGATFGLSTLYNHVNEKHRQ